MVATIIIPTYNKLKYLDLVLASAVNQSSKNFEVVIINDGGQDISSLIRKYKEYLDIQYINQENKGRASARNCGLKKAQGDVIIFNDDDRILDTKFVETHMRAVSQNEDTVNIGRKSRIITYWDRGKLPIKESYIEKMQCQILPMLGLAPQILWEQNIQLISSKDIMEQSIDFEKISLGDAGDNFLDVIEKFSYNLEGFAYAWFLGTTANISMSRNLIGDTKFDEAYITWGCEDIDFSYQLKQQGANFRYISEARNFHQIHPIGKGRYSVWDKINQDRENIKNLSYFANKFNNVEAILLLRGFQNTQSIIKINEIYQKIKGDICLQDNIYWCMKD